MKSITSRKFTNDEREEIIRLMTDAGFKKLPDATDPALMEIMTGLFFEIPLTSTETENVKTFIGKNHFSPFGYRFVSVFNCYVTSNIRGDFRKYRTRTTYPKDILNIFSYVNDENGDDMPIESVKKFIADYRNLNYNISK